MFHLYNVRFIASSQWLRRLQGTISGVWASSGLLEKQWCDNICHCQILERVGWRGIIGGMFVIIVYACDVMSPTNTENVDCRLSLRLVCRLLEVMHQNTRMQLVQIRGSCDGLLGWKITPRWNYGRAGWQRTNPDSCWSSSFSQQEILTDMTADAYRNNSQQAEILSYTQTDKKKLLHNILESCVEQLQKRDEWWSIKVILFFFFTKTECVHLAQNQKYIFSN